MSADNWAICPRCKAKKDVEAETRVKAAQDAYGKVSAEKYTQLLDAAKAPVAYGNSLREDYRLGIDEDGDFTVSYRGSCRDCGFSHEFKHEEQVPI